MSAPHRQMLPARAELETDYEIVRELGRGGMGVVYLARERATGRDVAIKLVRARYLEDEETVRRFAREARTVSMLRHPGIIATENVLRLGDNDLALVMGYVPGRTLRELMRRSGPLSHEAAEHVLVGVAAALGYAHQQGIVHRDVKPENIFLAAENGQPLLSDFGIARPIETESAVTLTGVAIGTPTYMSPEQIDGTPIDGRSDLYSLGLVGWEMLTGCRPWDGESLYSVIYKQKHERLPELDRLRPGIPPHLLLAIQGAVEKDPEDRWTSAEELLDQLASRSGVRAPRRGAVPRPRPRSVPVASARNASTTMRLPRAPSSRDEIPLLIPERDAEYPLPAFPRRWAGARRPAVYTAMVLLLMAALAFVTSRDEVGGGPAMASSEARGGPLPPPATEPRGELTGAPASRVSSGSAELASAAGRVDEQPAPSSVDASQSDRAT
ncbi:MAG: protein kinase domain-containing protein, partial [Gemmatimonadaceae bacterium]